jgi:hypothetical protein
MVAPCNTDEVDRVTAQVASQLIFVTKTLSATTLLARKFQGSMCLLVSLQVVRGSDKTASTAHVVAVQMVPSIC